MAREIDLRFDFSLVDAGNLRGGDGIPDGAFRDAVRRAWSGAAVLLSRHAAGEIGFPDLPYRMNEARAISRHAAAVRRRFTHLLVLGIGGSALGTRAVYEGVGGAAARRGVALSVADNVDPDAFFPLVRALPLGKTLVVAISKSGGTAETNAQLAVAAEALRKANGAKWKEHLVVVTDPEKGLFRALAAREGLASYAVPPNVGGRFSVLTPVGLFPLAAAGVDIGRLLAGARWMESLFRAREEKNPVIHAAAVYSHYMIENPKPVHAWFTYGAGLERVAEWWQQLWAESLGKRRPDGAAVGQTPVRAVGVTDQHSQVQLYQEGPADKIFTFVRWMQGAQKGSVPRRRFAPGLELLAGRPLRDLFSAEFEGTIGALWEAGRPVVRIELGRRDEAHIGAFIQFWEWVTALAGEAAGVDPFDQPGVEQGKRITRALMGDPGAAEIKRRFERAMRDRAPSEVRVRARA